MGMWWVRWVCRLILAYVPVYPPFFASANLRFHEINRSSTLGRQPFTLLWDNLVRDMEDLVAAGSNACLLYIGRLRFSNVLQAFTITMND